MEDLSCVDNLTKLRKLFNIITPEKCESYTPPLLAHSAVRPRTRNVNPNPGIHSVLSPKKHGSSGDDSDCDEPPFLAPCLTQHIQQAKSSLAVRRSLNLNTVASSNMGKDPNLCLELSTTEDKLFYEPSIIAPVFSADNMDSFQSPYPPGSDEDIVNRPQFNSPAKSASAIPEMREKRCTSSEHSEKEVVTRALTSAITDVRTSNLENQLELLGLSLKIDQTDAEGVRKGLLMLRPFSPEHSENSSGASHNVNLQQFTPHEKCPIIIPEAFAALEAVFQHPGKPSQIWVSGRGTNALAIADWFAQSTYELSFQYGDLIDISFTSKASNEKAWFFGTLMGKATSRVWKLPRDLSKLKNNTGFFPAKCVHILKGNTPKQLSISESNGEHFFPQHATQQASITTQQGTKPLLDGAFDGTENCGEKSHVVYPGVKVDPTKAGIDDTNLPLPEHPVKSDSQLIFSTVTPGEIIHTSTPSRPLQPFLEVPMWHPAQSVDLHISMIGHQVKATSKSAEGTEPEPSTKPFKLIRSFYEQLPAKTHKGSAHLLRSEPKQEPSPPRTTPSKIETDHVLNDAWSTDRHAAKQSSASRPDQEKVPARSGLSSTSTDADTQKKHDSSGNECNAGQKEEDAKHDVLGSSSSLQNGHQSKTAAGLNVSLLSESIAVLPPLSQQEQDADRLNATLPIPKTPPSETTSTTQIGSNGTKFQSTEPANRFRRDAGLIPTEVSKDASSGRSSPPQQALAASAPQPPPPPHHDNNDTLLSGQTSVSNIYAIPEERSASDSRPSTPSESTLKGDDLAHSVTPVATTVASQVATTVASTADAADAADDPKKADNGGEGAAEEYLPAYGLSALMCAPSTSPPTALHAAATGGSPDGTGQLSGQAKKPKKTLFRKIRSLLGI